MIILYYLRKYMRKKKESKDESRGKIPSAVNPEAKMIVAI